MLRISPHFVFSVLVAAGIAMTLAAPARAACPAGSQFFAWGGAGGCVANGEQVRKCYHMPKNCQVGWSQEHQDEGGVWCCPPDSGKQAGPKPGHPPTNETCMWRGTAPICKGRCEDGEATRDASNDGEGSYAGFGNACLSGLKVYCCRATFPN